jgi:hypothetical protein
MHHTSITRLEINASNNRAPGIHKPCTLLNEPLISLDIAILVKIGWEARSRVYGAESHLLFIVWLPGEIVGRVHDGFAFLIMSGDEAAGLGEVGELGGRFFGA